ncbi:MAG: GCAxxG family protein [Firmicutes bacterium]|nr:GCAxxG family protein [Bacillota bacterium]
MRTNTIKIVAIGDSITYGYPYEPALSWLNLTAERLNIDYMNQGLNGDMTDGMLNRFDCDVLRYKPSHVVIMGGTNDAYAGMTVNQVMKNIHHMVELAMQKGIIPILGLPIPCNDLAEEKLLGEYRTEMRQYAEEHNIEIIDFHKNIVDDDGIHVKAGLYCDDVHPSIAGYEVMAGVAAKFFVKVLIDARAHDYYWKEDFSCAITTLKILSEIFNTKFDQQVMDAAFGLNAGRLGSQCGLVEGALMFIGIYGQKKGLVYQGITELCHTFSSSFQVEFGSVLCKKLRPQGFSPDDPPHLCENITKRAIWFSTEFISKNIGLDFSNMFMLSIKRDVLLD